MSNERTTAGPQAADPGSEVRAKAGYRPEVQGLRALAVLMVVTYHVWLGRVSGGVDIFLLISAFLMTLSFARKVESGKPLRLASHWLHLLKRLLPAVVVVILGVLAGTRLVLPESRWPDVLDQAWASLLYRQNWLLADTAVDYYAPDHAGASPLQHFWSLSIQGQVFLLWPLVFAAGPAAAAPAPAPGAGWLSPRCWPPRSGRSSWCRWRFPSSRPPPTRRTPTSTRAPGSGSSPSARCWRSRCRTSARQALRVVLGWAGLAAMLACGLLLQVHRSFPGFIALWPTLAAAAIIVAGQTAAARRGPLAGLEAAGGLGGNSYALYLWHWPVLVLALAARGSTAPA